MNHLLFDQVFYDTQYQSYAGTEANVIIHLSHELYG